MTYTGSHSSADLPEGSGRQGRHPRRSKAATGRLAATRALAVAVAVLAVCGLCGVVGTSGATMTALTHNRDEVLAGDLRVINSSADEFIIDAPRLGPGQTVTGDLMLTNQGDFTAGCTVTRGGLTGASSALLSQSLYLAISDITGQAPTSVWTGTVAGLANVSLAPLALGETRRYRIALTFPESGVSPVLQGASASFQLVFTAVAQ